MKEVELSVIILSFNTKDLLKQCLESVLEGVGSPRPVGRPQVEVIVVDNHSTDDSPAMVKQEFPAVILVESPENWGFARGNNLGLAKAKGKFVLFLNSDTKVFPDTLKKMLAYLEENPGVGVATCRVEFSDGSLDPASHRGFPTPWNSLAYFLGLEKLFPRVKIFSGYHLGYLDQNTIHEIDTPTGAFYLVRREVLKEVGSFDEKYFMYAEDIDLSLRIKQAGWKIMFVPEAKIIHFKKQSGREKKVEGKITQTAREVREKTIKHFFESMKLFYDTHYRGEYPFVTRWLVLSGIWIFTRLKILQNKFL